MCTLWLQLLTTFSIKSHFPRLCVPHMLNASNHTMIYIHALLQTCDQKNTPQLHHRWAKKYSPARLNMIDICTLSKQTLAQRKCSEYTYWDFFKFRPLINRLRLFKGFVAGHHGGEVVKVGGVSVQREQFYWSIYGKSRILIQFNISIQE